MGTSHSANGGTTPGMRAHALLAAVMTMLLRCASGTESLHCGENHAGPCNPTDEDSPTKDPFDENDCHMQLDTGTGLSRKVCCCKSRNLYCDCLTSPNPDWTCDAAELRWPTGGCFPCARDGHGTLTSACCPGNYWVD